jgi:DNA-binding FrmR family transcriptional regulator
MLMAIHTQADVIARLKKIEGQVRGLQKMVEEAKDCRDVVTQLAAARKALDKVGFIILSHRMQECVEKAKQNGYDDKDAIEEAMELFLTLA